MYTIYHNPRCRKSRETLQLLQDNGVEPEVVLYLENPPTKEELTHIAELLAMHPIEFTRTKEDQFKALQEDLGIDKKTVSPEEMIAHMAAHPILIERPIVIKKDENGQEIAAVLGRPPENTLTLLK